MAAAALGRHALVEPYARELEPRFNLATPRRWHLQLGQPESKNLAPISAAGVAATAFALGIILFSGTLYALGITGSLPVEGAAPAGGLLLMTGWLTVALLGGCGLIARKR